jgi:hypothetical protein
MAALERQVSGWEWHSAAYDMGIRSAAWGILCCWLGEAHLLVGMAAGVGMAVPACVNQT